MPVAGTLLSLIYTQLTCIFPLVHLINHFTLIYIQHLPIRKVITSLSLTLGTRVYHDTPSRLGRSITSLSLMFETEDASRYTPPDWESG
jgi:hypothetical protein